MSSWITMIQPQDADGELLDVYGQVRSPHGTVDNVMKVHSLQPRTMLGHLRLYESILHNPDVVLPGWLLEVISSYVSIINGCDYSLAHHFANARKLIADDDRADRVYAALQAGQPELEFAGKELAMLNYASRLTTDVARMREQDIETLRQEGCTDTEILEINQVVAYFNYSNRVLNGLGVTTEGDTVGYYAEHE
jgi:uncharacterized peroxidase-related enzyme